MKGTCSLVSSTPFWAPYHSPGVTKCNSSPQVKWRGTTHASSSITRVHRCGYQFIFLDHLCPTNPIRMGRLFWKGPGSANRKHFCRIKRMTITRRAKVTKTEAGHPSCAAVITHIQPITPELDLLAVLEGGSTWMQRQRK